MDKNEILETEKLLDEINAILDQEENKRYDVLNTPVGSPLTNPVHSNDNNTKDSVLSQWAEEFAHEWNSLMFLNTNTFCRNQTVIKKRNLSNGEHIIFLDLQSKLLFHELVFYNN